MTTATKTMTRGIVGEVRDQLRRGLAGGRVMKAWIFGSCARGTATSESDVDMLIEPVPGRKCSLLDLAGLEIELTELLSRPVHVLTRGDLDDVAWREIEKERVLVYG